MALIKIIGVGDELIFSVGSRSDGTQQQVSIVLTEKAGRQAVLKITADKSIGITTVSPKKVWLGTPA